MDSVRIVWERLLVPCCKSVRQSSGVVGGDVSYAIQVASSTVHELTGASPTAFDQVVLF